MVFLCVSDFEFVCVCVCGGGGNPIQKINIHRSY